MRRLAFGPAPEALLSMTRAFGPQNAMLAFPSCARGALLAITASEPSSHGCKKLNLSTFFAAAASRAAKNET